MTALTRSESAVVERLSCLRVATMATLRNLLGFSHMTVARALSKHGYFSSFNHNSAFYVLADVPHFDDDGLWWHGDVGFSCRHTLQATLLHLIDRSAAGCTVAELEARLSSRLGNLLSRLARAGLVGRTVLDRRAVYLSADASRQAQQRLARNRPGTPRQGLPPGLPTTTLIELLVQLVGAPQASPASLSQTLQARGTAITADQVRSVFDFYDLKKSWAR